MRTLQDYERIRRMQQSQERILDSFSEEILVKQTAMLKKFEQKEAEKKSDRISTDDVGENIINTIP